MATFAQSVEGKDTTRPTEEDIKKFLSHAKIALEEAQQVSDPVLMKVHPEFKDHFRNEFQKALELLVKGIEGGDTTDRLRAVQLLNKWDEYTEKSSHDFEIPK
jgi:predicted sugar kinase